MYKVKETFYCHWSWLGSDPNQDDYEESIYDGVVDFLQVYLGVGFDEVNNSLQGDSHYFYTCKGITMKVEPEGNYLRINILDTEYTPPKF